MSRLFLPVSPSRMTATTTTTPYGFKPEALSSHSRMLACFPASGRGGRVLDVGGGEGYLATILVTRGFEVVCVAAPGTVSPEMPATVSVIEADLDYERPHVGRSFDYVVCGDVLEHLRTPVLTLDWIAQSLAPSGQLIASLPNGMHAYVRLRALLGHFPEDERGLFDRTHLHFYSWKAWSALFARAGFRIDRMWPTPVPIGLLVERWRGRAPVRALEALSYGAAAIWTSLLAYQFVVVARRR